MVVGSMVGGVGLVRVFAFCFFSLMLVGISYLLARGMPGGKVWGSGQVVPLICGEGGLVA